ncbi:MAG TPA: ribosome maturation factor RimP [Bdellovibrionota bacterium]|nr:ribosome maturation factor RimP [Bdellovibrionota bacterium]
MNTGHRPGVQERNPYRLTTEAQPATNLSSLSISKTATETRLIENTAPVLASLGYELVDIEVVERQNGIIRIVIGNLPGAEMIGVDDCEKAHRELGPLFDVWDPMPYAYTLELSSPGENPPMRTIEHFRAACGGQIKFQTLEPYPMPPPAKARKNWQVDLIDVGDDGVILVKDTLGEHRIPIGQIRSASRLQEWKP